MSSFPESSIPLFTVRLCFCTDKLGKEGLLNYSEEGTSLVSSPSYQELPGNSGTYPYHERASSSDVIRECCGSGESISSAATGASPEIVEVSSSRDVPKKRSVPNNNERRVPVPPSIHEKAPDDA